MQRSTDHENLRQPIRSNRMQASIVSKPPAFMPIMSGMNSPDHVRMMSPNSSRIPTATFHSGGVRYSIVFQRENADEYSRELSFADYLDNEIYQDNRFKIQA
jgi:hypothetical protein